MTSGVNCDSDGNCWYYCPDCQGEGGYHDCGEDCCCCLDKEEITHTCETCGGTGNVTCNHEEHRRSKSMIKLGTLARDRITGFEGIAIGRTEWLYGCVRIGLEPQELHDGKPIEAQWFDEQRIVELGEIPVCAGASEDEGAGPGGPRNDSASRRTDPTR